MPGNKEYDKETFALSISQGLTSVAGYDQVGASMFFSYQTADGLLNQNTKDTSFYCGTYSFDNSLGDDLDGNTLYLDLQNKLTTVYGEHSDEYTFDIKTSAVTNTWYIIKWLDDNNASCILTQRHVDFEDNSEFEDYDSIHIYYLANNWEEILDTGHKAYIGEEIVTEVDNSDNVLGL